jgi:ribosomal protein L7Ae-like RNA K-turn-binding protein
MTTTNDVYNFLSKIHFTFRKHFKIGVNSTIRSLQSQSAECLMISSNISPRLLAKQIINMALNRNPAITIIVVPTMSDIFKNIFGITCCVCAGEDVSPDFRKFMQEATSTFEKPQQFLLKTAKQVETNVEKVKKESQPAIDFQKVYLKRPSNGDRAFTPNSKHIKINTQDVQPVWNDYITFNDDADKLSDTKMDTDEYSDKEKIESTVIQLKDLNLPSIAPQPTLELKKKKKRKKVKNTSASDVVKYTPTVARKVYGNPLKKKKNKKNKTNV